MGSQHDTGKHEKQRGNPYRQPPESLASAGLFDKGFGGERLGLWKVRRLLALLVKDLHLSSSPQSARHLTGGVYKDEGPSLERHTGCLIQPISDIDVVAANESLDRQDGDEHPVRADAPSTA
jgi:hypothetical protein